MKKRRITKNWTVGLDGHLYYYWIQNEKTGDAYDAKSYETKDAAEVTMNFENLQGYVIRRSRLTRQMEETIKSGGNIDNDF